MSDKKTEFKKIVNDYRTQLAIMEYLQQQLLIAGKAVQATKEKYHQLTLSIESGTEFTFKGIKYSVFSEYEGLIALKAVEVGKEGGESYLVPYLADFLYGDRNSPFLYDPMTEEEIKETEVIFNQLVSKKPEDTTIIGVG